MLRSRSSEPNTSDAIEMMATVDASDRAAMTVDLRAPTSPAPLPNVVTSRGRRPWWLRWSAGSYLLMGDAATFLAVSAAYGHQPGVQIPSLAALLLTLSSLGLYRSRLTLSVIDDAPYIAAGVAASSLLTVALTTMTTRPPITDVLQQAPLIFVALILARLLAYTLVHRARCSGAIRHTTLVLGAGWIGIQLVRAMREHRQYGVDAVGFVDESARIEDMTDLPAPLLGGYAQLSPLLRSLDVKLVIIAFGTMRESQLVDVVRTCHRLNCEIMLVPRLFEVHARTHNVDELRGIPLIRVRRAPFRTLSWRLKRVFDILVSAVVLTLSSPLLLICAVAVRLDNGPDIFFRQDRLGLDGRLFTLVKFRTVRPGSAANSDTTWNVKGSDDISQIGHLLRRTSFDELPQLWNVLRGDMSLVGPRPERPYFVEEFRQVIPRYASRSRVPVGLTGWAQVNGLRGDTSIEERAAFDNYYIENWSLWLDIKILLRTLGEVLRGSGG